MKEMLSIQNGLNLKFVGPDWMEDARKRQKINYGTAILEEAQELQACDLSWKWWKSGHPSPDMGNAKVELIDLLHFVMSDALATEDGYLDEDDVSRNLGGPIPYVAGEMARSWQAVYSGNNGVAELSTTSICYNPIKMRIALHQLVASALQGASPLQYEGIEDDIGVELNESKVEMEASDYNSMSSIDWAAFWATAFHLGLSLTDVYNTYLGKAALNAFRIANGDKEGTYHRNWWSGRQDNYYMMEYITKVFNEEGVPPTMEQALSWMESTYVTYLASEARSLIGAN